MHSICNRANNQLFTIETVYKMKAYKETANVYTDFIQWKPILGLLKSNFFLSVSTLSQRQSSLHFLISIITVSLFGLYSDCFN